MIAEVVPASFEASQSRKRAVVLGFPVRRSGTHAVQEICKGGPTLPILAFPMRRRELEEEILALWEG